MKQKMIRLTQEKFFQIATWMNKNREMLIKERYNGPQLLGLIKEATGIDISESSLAGLKSATQIDYRPRQQFNNGKSGTRLEYLAKIIADLLTELGKEVPAELRSIIRHEPKPQAAPIPVSKVIDPKTFNVVNK